MGFRNVVQDLSKALELYTKAAENWDNRIAQYMIGMMHIAGYGVDQDYKKAIKWFLLSARNGWTYAIARMGLVYQMGYGVTIDPKKAIFWYEKLFTREEEVRPINDKLCTLFGNDKFTIKFDDVVLFTAAKNNITSNMTSICKSMISSRLFGTESLSEMTFWIMMSNQFCCIPASQFELGYLYNETYRDMHGIRNDFINDEKALVLLKKTAENGHHEAQDMVARNYEHGVLVEKNYVEAMKWYSKSKDQGSPGGLYGIGCLYYSGHDSIKKDLKRALVIFYRLLNLIEHGGALLKVGAIYEHGEEGIEQNYKMAFEYYSRAADSGVALGAAKMGLFYLEGHGIQKDYKKAFDCLNKAANKNCPEGFYGLGRMFYSGFYVDEGLNRALELFKKAREGGYSPAEVSIDEVETRKLKKSIKIIKIPKEHYEQFEKTIDDTEKKEAKRGGKKKSNKHGGKINN